MIIKVGVIGAGVMGAEHARLLSSVVSDAEVTAVSDPDAKRLAEVVETCGTARAFADPLELIRDKSVDAVLIASPDQTHAALVLACLEIEKPVLCEKPLAATAEECLRVIAREEVLKRRLVTAGYMRRFDPGYLEMKRRLDEGDLGAALVMHCIHRNVASSPFATAAMLISGSAVHEIDIARFVLAREVQRVTVVTPRKTSLAAIQDPQIIFLEMEDRVVVEAEIFVNAQYGYDVRAELVCEKGTITLTPPHDVTVAQAAGESFSFPGDWRARFAHAYRAELQAWVDGLRGNAPSGASAWDGYVATAVADAGLKSLATGQPQAVNLAPRPGLYA